MNDERPDRFRSQRGVSSHNAAGDGGDLSGCRRGRVRGGEITANSMLTQAGGEYSEVGRSVYCGSIRRDGDVPAVSNNFGFERPILPMKHGSAAQRAEIASRSNRDITGEVFGSMGHVIVVGVGADGERISCLGGVLDR